MCISAPQRGRQRQWEEVTKGAITKEFFSKCRKQTGSESKLKSKFNNNHDGPWKYSILLPSIKNCRKSKLPIQTLHTNGRPSAIPLQKLKNKREILNSVVFNNLTPEIYI
jgi:hypothetical protein